MSDELITGRVLRTVLRPDVYNKLEDYARTLTTGFGKWDFGVAVERLLDLAELDERFSLLDERIRLLEMRTLAPEDKREENKDEMVLGTYHLKKGEKKDGKD